MEVQTANNHLTNSLLSQTSPTTLLPSTPLALQINSSIIIQHSQSNSPASSSSELQDLELKTIATNSGSTNCCVVVTPNKFKSTTSTNGSLSGASSTVSTTYLEGGSGGDDAEAVSLSLGATAFLINGNNNNNNDTSNTAAAQVKKRISSSRTPTRKARRIKFYRNGDRFYPGLTIPVSNERYRSFESLFEDLTRLLEENVKIPGAVRTIYTMCGKKVTSLDELEDGQSYICSCNNENFKKIDYNTSSQPLANLTLSTKSNTRFTKVNRPSSPLKNGSISANSGANAASSSTSITNGSPILVKLSERDRVVHPRIVTLIRNGTKPRKIMRLLLNKRNSPSFDHVLTAITQVVRLDTGYVRKVFTLSGNAVIQLADFFGSDDVFFAYGTERVNNPEDFKLESDEQKAIQSIRKTLRTVGSACMVGPKPKMPIKSKNIKNMPEETTATTASTEVTEAPAQSGCHLYNESGIDAYELPTVVRDRYALGQIIGDGNFAIVIKVKDRRTGLPYALKIIDKSKCKGKEHYIDAEVRVMKKLQHQHIIGLILEVDMPANMYLVLEYVGGGDLFDAITRVTRFSEDQSRVMIRHLAAAMAYLHSMSIVHRDIKPENLLVELDDKGNVVELKLADFGLACEVTEPLVAVCGTPTYVAPEILMETGYGLKIDVWAAGIILYILLCGFPPFVSPDNEQEPLFDAIISGVYEFPDPYWSDIGDGVRDLIANMLQSDPDVRFTSEDILDHSWTMGEDVEGSGDYASLIAQQH